MDKCAWESSIKVTYKAGCRDVTRKGYVMTGTALLPWL